MSRKLIDRKKLQNTRYILQHVLESLVHEALGSGHGKHVRSWLARAVSYNGRPPYFLISEPTRVLS